MSVNTSLAARALSPGRSEERREAAAEKAGESTADAKGDGEGISLGFEDVLDAVNPLQQLPVVSAVYREVSGDEISIPSRLAGGLLFGGPTGLLGAAAMVLFEEITGDSVLGHLEALADDVLPADEPAAPAVASAAGGSFPWLADAAPGAAPGAGSQAALDEALRRSAAAAAEAAQAAAAAAAAAPADPLAPETLAKLYTLEATDSRGENAVRV